MISFLSNAVLVVKRMQHEADQQKGSGGREHGCRKNWATSKRQKALKRNEICTNEEGEIYASVCCVTYISLYLFQDSLVSRIGLRVHLKTSCIP